MARLAGVVLVFLVGALIGWGGRALHGRQDAWQAVVAQRGVQARSLYLAYRQQPTRTRLILYVRAALNFRDALSVARFPNGDDPHRYEPSPDLARLLIQLDAESTTPAERQEWQQLQNLAYNPSP